MPLLAKKELCTGCTACWAICPRGCIDMVPDENGFLFPKINEDNCVGCGLCVKTCPVLSERTLPERMPRAYAAYSNRNEIRTRSSSGGIFSELAISVLRHGGVIFGAAYDKAFRVIHTCVEAEEQLQPLCGAKYAQSNLGATFPQVKERLEQGQWVMFSGTPCQVAGLKTFLKKEYNNLITVDFVCHGIPSPTAWQQYVKHRAEADALGEFPSQINLRSKETGWSRYGYSCRFEYPSGTVHSEKSSESVYMKLFVGDCINRQACSACEFKGVQRCSDITLGDFWGVWDIVPEMDDNKGTSVVLIQSEKGQDLWNKISDKIKFKEVSHEQASQQNPSMLGSSKANPKREEVLNQIREGQIEKCENLFVQPEISAMDRWKGRIHRLIGKRLS